MTGSELIVEQLKRLGVTSVFAVAGASHMMLLDALDKAGIGIISNRHESGAIGAADGYSRTSGKLGVALIVADQGLANGIGGLSVAWHAQSSILVLAVSLPRFLRETQTEVDQDQLQLVTPLTRWARAVPSAARLGDFLETACRLSLSAKPGPTFLMLQEGFYTEEVKARPEPNIQLSALYPESAAVEKAVDILLASKRPMVITGAGACKSGASEALTAINQEFGIPVVGNSLGRGVVAEDWQSAFSWPYAQTAAKEADCVLVFGSRLTQRQGFGLPPRFAPDAHFIQVDIDADNLHRNRPMDVAIWSDAGLAAQALLDTLREKAMTRKDALWLSKALETRKNRVAELIQDEGDRADIHPLTLADRVSKLLPEGAVYVGDGADIQSWMYGAVAIKQAPGFMDHYPQGAMGSGTALSIGAATALRDAAGNTEPPPVVLLTGDGSMGFMPAELHAAAMAGLRLVIIVGNDGAWGTEYHLHKKILGRAINTELGYLPFEKMAEGFGCKGLVADSIQAMESALSEAFANTGPTLVNVIIDKQAGASLKEDDSLRMIIFSDLVEGQEHIAGISSD